MNGIANVSRRRFLRTGALAGGGLILGFTLADRTRAVAADPAPAPAGPPAPPLQPDAFIRIGEDESVTFVANHAEMGQGVYTALALMLAEELEADWSKVRVESAPVAPVYNHPFLGLQMTGGSTSCLAEWRRLRLTGAAARVMLVGAAAETWQVDPAACRAENGRVIHDASGRQLSFGRLAAQAAHRPVPSEQELVLKDPKNFRLVGKPTRRLDTPAKSNGTAVFGLDIAVPGMLVAVVARPPVFGAKLKSFDATAAQAVRGVRHVVAIETGVAVVADNFWAASTGRDALVAEWDEGSLASFDTAAQGEQYAALARQPGIPARHDGDATAALATAAKRIEAVYELPYLAHAPMEPLNCVADVRSDRCEIWTGTQFQTPDRLAAAAAAGLKPEQVQLHTTLLGGGFGRRAVPDSHFVREAVLLSKAVAAPVKVVWTREDDIRGGYYRPRALHAIDGGLDAAGHPVAWRHHIVCQSFMAGTPFEAFVFKDGVDGVAVEGAADVRYRIPHVHLAWHQAPAGVPTLWWRSVGHSHTAFAVESFIDELAHAAGRDPFEYRRSLLADHPRHRGVLELAAEKAGWGQPLPAGVARGIAVHESFGSFVAQVAEVSLVDGWPRVRRVVVAIDCGPVVNPDGVRAQMEGAVVFGLSAALHGEITFEKGRVRQSNFDDYPILRLRDMPVVEVHIAPSTEPMGGAGEPGVPPSAPAFANALFALTGRRIRRLPLRSEDLKPA